MASDNEACCESDPNFAVICGFLEKFGVTCGLSNIDFLDLQDMLENSQEVSQELIDLHIKLLRKARKSVSTERWERAIIKLCHGFCSQDAWEIERFGYKKARLSSKLRILKELLEMQFDYNVKFKNEINKLSAEELRTQPLGRDRGGHVYWFQSDNSCQIRVYKEDPDEETWTLVAKDREGLVNLITELNDGKETVLNEDSNSLESEKPVIDTGQTDSSSNSQSAKSDQANTTTENPPELAKPEESSEKSEADAEEPTQTVEIIKPGKIRIKNKELLTSEVSEAIDCTNGNSTMEESRLAVSTDQETKEKSQVVVSPPKSGISIRIKPISELISPPLDVTKKEVTGVKEKYIRTESSSSSSTHHRKAVDSAGFDVHTNYLKRPIEEEEDVEDLSYIKRPRLDRPTLLGNKKKKPYSDEEEEEEEEEEEVSDEIEEPLMLVTGEGLGQDNEGGNFKNFPRDADDNPVVGEEIEEPVFYFCGEGNGNECETGNESLEKEKASQESASSSNSKSSTPLQEKNDVVDSIDNKSLELPKPEYKLGTIIDVRSSQMVSRKRDPKKSRWDIRKPEESRENSDNVCNINSDSNQEDEKPQEKCASPLETDENEEKLTENPKSITPNKMFFFGPGCLQVKPVISSLKASSTFGESVTKVVDENKEEEQTISNPENESCEPHSVSAEDTASKSISPVLNLNHVSKNNENEDFHEQCDTEMSSPSPKQPNLVVLNQKEDELSPNSITANQHVPNSSVSAKEKTDNFSVIQDVKLNNVPVFDKSSLLDTQAVAEDRLCSKNEVLPNEDQPVHVPEKPKNTVEEVLESAQKTDNVEIIPAINSGTSKEDVEDASEKEESSSKGDILPEKPILNQGISVSGDKSLLNDQGAELPMKPSDRQELAENVEEKLTLMFSKLIDDEKPTSITIDKMANSEKSSIDGEDNTSKLHLATIEHSVTNEEKAQTSKNVDTTIPSENPKLNECISVEKEEKGLQISKNVDITIPAENPNLNECISPEKGKEVDQISQNVDTTIPPENPKLNECSSPEKEEKIEHKKPQKIDDQEFKKSEEIVEKEDPFKVDEIIKDNSIQIGDTSAKNPLIIDAKINDISEDEVDFKTSKDSELNIFKNLPDSIPSSEGSTIIKQIMNVSSKSHSHEDFNKPQTDNRISTSEKRPEEIEVCKNSSSIESITNDGKLFDENENKNIEEDSEIEKSDDISEVSKKEQENVETVPAFDTREEYVENKSPESVASSPLDATSFQHSDIEDEVIEDQDIDDVANASSNSTDLESKSAEQSVDTGKDDKDQTDKQEERYNKQNIEQSVLEKVDLLEQSSKETVSEDNANETTAEDKVTSDKEHVAKVELEKIIIKPVEEGETSKPTPKELEVAETSIENDAANKTIIEERNNAPMEDTPTNKVAVDEIINKATTKETETNKAAIEEITASNATKEETETNKAATEKIATNKEVTVINKAATEKIVTTKGIMKETVPTKDITEEIVTTKGITKETVPAKGITEEIVTTKGITKETVPTKGITEEIMTIKGITKETVTTKGTTEEIMTTKGVTKETVTTKGITEEIMTTKGITKETVTTKGITEEIMTTKGITKETVTTKGITEEIATTKGITKETVTTKGITEEIVTTKGITKETVTPKGITEEIVTTKGITKETATNKGIPEETVTNKVVTEEVMTNKAITEETLTNQGATENQAIDKFNLNDQSANKAVIQDKEFNTVEDKTAPVEDKEKPKHAESAKAVAIETTSEFSKAAKISEESSPPEKITVSRRSTRRTRSSINEALEEPLETTEIKTDGNKDDKVDKPKRGRRKRGTVKPDDSTNISEQKEIPVESGRELRQRKVSDVKVEKQVKKGRGRPKLNNKTEEKAENDGNQQQQIVLDLIDIEDQIVKNEIIRPSKKLRLDSEDQKSKIMQDVEKKEQPRRRSLRSNQDKSEEKVVTNKDTPDKPVNEPKCVQKKVPLLTCVDINTLKDKSKEETETNSECVAADAEVDTCADSDDDITVIPDSDPLAVSDDENETPKPKMTLATFKIDLEDSIPIVGRITRKRAAQQSVDALRDSQTSEKKVEVNEDGDSKRPKLKKRLVDHNLRKSVEEQKLKVASSSEEEEKEKTKKPAKKVGRKGKAIVQRRVSTRSATADSPAISSDAPSEASRTDNSNTPPPVVKQKKPRSQKKKTLMGLEISEVNETLIRDEGCSGVRQSRRIAQIKIKEEAERRKLEEVTFQEIKDEQKKRKGKKGEDKDYKLEKKKRSKNVVTEDETTCDAESDEKKKRKRKRKHWDPTKKIDLHHAWKASSGSSSSEVEDEDEEIEDDDDTQLVMRSDHEFSPESDLEDGGEVQPLKRARTARKESDAEEEVDDCACQKCGQKDHPEWILLCDSCDSGWHCSCLRPALLVIPEGDWFCPPCQHITLVKNLESRLQEYDKKLNKLEMETRRKERLAYVGISLDNVLPSKDSEEHRRKNRQKEDDVESRDEDRDSDESDSDESGSDSESSSSSGSDSDEPIYQLRERRQTHSYRFNDYDELINSAIQDEMEAVKGAGNQGRGKDIATIVNAEKEEEAQRLRNEANNTDVEVAPPVEEGVPVPLPENGAEVPEKPPEPEPEPLPPVVPLDYDAKAENESDNEIIRPVRKIISKKKHRKLNCLDVSSGDDPESDEDFKGSSSSGTEEELDEFSGSESSDASARRGKRRKDYAPIRRSTRARTSRYDRDFINDDSDSDDGEAPRRKRNRSLWDESEESEESDRSWGRRKRRGGGKPRRKQSVGKVKKSKKKKKKKRGDDSDPEVYRKKPNIKFGGLNNDEEDIGRRTRGKKINYLEALGTDSEEEIRRKPPRIEESEEEYNLHDDEDFQQMENNKDSDDSGPDPVLQEIAKSQPKSKPKGRGKAGLKIPRKPKDQPPPDFATLTDLSKPLLDPLPPGAVPSMLPPLPDIPGISSQLPLLPPVVAAAASVIGPAPPVLPPILMQTSVLQDELQDPDDEPNPIEQINKNVEQMNEQEMEKMMEEEDYANKQLQLVALQIEKEKKRKEREAKRLQTIIEQDKTPKKRGRKPKSAEVTPHLFSEGSLLNSSMTNNAELSEPPGVSLPMFSEIAPVLSDGTPKKRGRAKGKKEGGSGTPGKNTPESEMGVDSPGSAVSPAPNSPLHGSKLAVAAPPQPFSQSQPTPSVITRMLQSQPGQENFTTGGKFFSDDPATSQAPSGPYHPGGPRGSLSSSYQQPPPGMPPHYPVVRSGPAPPHRLHSPGSLPPMYHHRSMDPSPSGGGPINVSTANRDRHSPVVPPAASSPLSKGDPTPPPPPYTRPQGPFSSAPVSTSGPRHIALVPPHFQQHRPTNMSPYHPGMPPNYYGSYPPPPLNDEGQSPPVYPSPAYAEYPEGSAPISGGENAKFDDETGGEFVGLVSYFSSQREDDLDT